MSTTNNNKSYNLITAEFTLEELLLLDDCIHFTRQCLDRDSPHLANDLNMLIRKFRLLLPKRYVHQQQTA